MPPRRPPVIPIAPASQEWSSLEENRSGLPSVRQEGLDRRTFLKTMAASAALASAGCSGPPQEKILPYVHMPEMQVPGQPLFYASTYTRRGYGQGVLVESNMGRPTKVEGNPRHPASLGATDTFTQASILQLWDPDRSQTVYQEKELSTWVAFETALLGQRSTWEASEGEGLHILTGSFSSPTLQSQLQALLARYPKANWHSHDPLADVSGTEGAQLAFGRAVEPVFHFQQADLVLTLDADVLGDWPGSIVHARDFVARRRSSKPEFASRLLAVEATPGLTGAMADNQLALPPTQIEQLLWRLAQRLGLGGLPDQMPPAPSARAERWEKRLAQQLPAYPGRSLIVGGPSLTPPSRALVHVLNEFLGNANKTVSYIEPVLANFDPQAGGLDDLTQAMHQGTVSALVMLDSNPVYTAPADLEFAQALERVPFSVHLGLYRDETARKSTWHLPQAHAYESWSDARTYDGTASIVQPVIAPLYKGRSAHNVLALLMDDKERNAHKLVQRHWQSRQGEGMEAGWQQALQTGVMAGTASKPLNLTVKSPPTPPSFEQKQLVALFVSDPSAGDGSFANNGWLQELPRPLTSLTWDNAALISPATAHTLGVESGDVVQLSLTQQSDRAIQAPIWVLPNHADHAVTLPLGYGRSAAGRVGNNVGFDAYRLRTGASLKQTTSLRVAKTGKRHDFAVRQGHDTMEGRDIVRHATREEYRRNPGFATDTPQKRVPDTSIYSEWSYPDYKWGMVIDLNACIGCNTCTIACQAENNIPVVGKEEVSRGRSMHWIRVDHYYQARNAVDSDKRDLLHHVDVPPEKQPGKTWQTLFQPVPCMHCENAPCEEVCPVGATMHDSEGLNVQVYNRCVGTRFCSNNCPYKVRRFNFFQYSNTDVESLKALQNPEVTVRQRGVMEKCTYCLQRVTRGRIAAEKEGRRLKDGEVVTACQAACPTEAIVFGDLNDPDSRVHHAKASPLDYSLLAELNTRPRTTYAARVVNPDTELE